MSNEPLVLPKMDPYSITIPKVPEGAWTHAVRLTWDKSLEVNANAIIHWPFFINIVYNLLYQDTAVVQAEIDPRAEFPDVLYFIDHYFADAAGIEPLGIRTFNPVRPPVQDEDFRREVEKQFDAINGTLRTNAEKPKKRIIQDASGLAYEVTD